MIGRKKRGECKKGRKKGEVCEREEEGGSRE